MLGCKGHWWLATALALLVGVGCAGILAESVSEDGRLERIRVEGGESWKLYDRNPTRGDDTAIMLKKESTF
jgi:hypothetical protein